MFTERLHDRAVELYDVGSTKDETLVKLNEMRNDFVEEDRNLLLNAGYSKGSVDKEVKAFDKRMKEYSYQLVNELYR